MENPLFNPALGNQEPCPPIIHIGAFMKARMNEITALTHVIETPSHLITTKREFPKHMRRRAMSHNVKRIPKRIRGFHEALREKSNTREGPNQVPRRKWRRRPTELLKEYNRRQRKNVWLETHIWHAKRFKMVEKWGYRLPECPTDKSYRACYRASSEHCLIQDKSYLSCIELRGDFKCIVEGLKCHTCDSVGTPFDSHYVIDGRREGRTTFYSNGRRPRGAIGDLSFIWRPETNDRERVLWAWAHPTCVKSVVEELVSTFGLERLEEMIIDDETSGVESEKLRNRSTTEIYSNAGLKLVLWKDSLNRFRLTGPLSQAVLVKTLQCIPENRTVTDWATDFFASDVEKSRCAEQNEFWAKMKGYASPAQLPPNMVLPLVVIDPRFTMPPSRIKAVNEDGDDTVVTPLPADLLHSPLWSAEIRQKVTSSKLSTHEINQIRSTKVVPGLDFEVDKSRGNLNFPVVPILAIQRPGCRLKEKRIGYGSGWDVILPSGYSMPFWLSFILNGARAGGLREDSLLERESGSVDLAPDTIGGKEEEFRAKEEATDQYFRLPPAKRHNYNKLGIPSPFKCQWDVLVKDWSGRDDFYVLRDRMTLAHLQKCLNKKDTANILEPPGALVPVTVTLKGKGELTSFAHICLQNVDSTLEEPVHTDVNASKRSELSSLHKNILKRLARKRKLHSGPEFDSAEIRKEHSRIMRNLWLPPNSSIKNACANLIIGFVSNAEFSFVAAKPSGVGYVSLDAVLAHMNLLSSGSVLVRCTNTMKYCPAVINVCL